MIVQICEWRTALTTFPGVAPFGEESAPPDKELDVDEFELVAYLSGTLVRASRRDGVMLADPALLERAKLLIAIGDSFAYPGSSVEVAAGLEDAIQAALTLVRAADRIIHFRLQLGGLTIGYSHE